MATETSDKLGPSTGDLFRGERVGKYEILTQLSVGGMAELFLAFTRGRGGFKKFVVIKRILPDVKSNESFVKMFLDEARITAALNHPNIAQVYDLGGDEEGDDEGEGLYLAMEFIPGQNLNQITSARLKRQERLPVGLCVKVARDLCLALHYAHSFVDSSGTPAPVIHRDVAQKNVMVTYDGEVKLLDFGIAKAKGSLGKTSVGMVKGTTGYMSPEQVRGEELDGRSDLFAVGVVLFETLTGRRLFSAPTEAEEMERILKSRIPDAAQIDSRIPREINEVIRRALARNREERFPNAKAMARALEGAAGEVMFDQEQAASFMRELFADKMRATRALLDSAGTDDQANVGHAAQAASSLREDVGSVFPGEQVSTDPAQQSPLPDAPAPIEPAEAQVEAPAPLESPRPRPRRIEIASIEAAPAVAPIDEPPRSKTWLVFLAGMCGALFFALALGFPILQHAFPADEEPVGEQRPIPEFGAARNPPAGDPKVDPAAPPRDGTLNLVTDEVCIVSAGIQALGRTPLLNAPLAPGSHTLTLEDEAGHQHTLSVLIRPGQSTTMNVTLESLPRAEGSSP